MDRTRQAEFLEHLEGQQRALVAIAAAYSHTADERAELVQEMQAQLWRSYPRYDARRPFSTWLYRVALNVALSHVRAESARAARQVPLECAAEPEAPPAEETDSRVAQLRAFIAELEPLPRALLLLYLEDRTHQEAAEILGLSEATAAKRISRLKQRLRERFETTKGDDP